MKTSRFVFGLGRIAGASYRDGDHGVYTFSMLLKDLIPSVKGTRRAPSGDVVWQFKHHGGGHDLHLELQGTQLRLGWGGNVYKTVVIANGMPYVNQWIDFRFDILWKSDDTGSFTFRETLRNDAPGTTLRLSFRRNGAVHRVQVTLRDLIWSRHSVLSRCFRHFMSA